MRAIKHTLTERFYVWEDAVKLAEDDPEVDLSGEGNPYTPMEYLEAEEGELDGQDKEKATSEAASAVDPSEIPAGQSQRDPARV